MIPIVIVFVTWIVIAHGLAPLVTIAVGAREETAVDLVAEPHGLWWCEHRLIGPSVERAFPPYICMKHPYFGDQKEPVAVRLVGYKTGFGFQVASMHRMEPR